MSDFQVRLHDGRIFNIPAWTEADIPTALEDEGIDRSLIARIKRLGTISDAILGV